MRAVERRWSLLIGLALLLGSPSLVSAEAEPETHVYRSDVQGGIYVAGELLLTVTEETARQLEQTIQQAPQTGRLATDIPALDALLTPYPLRAIERVDTPHAEQTPRDSADSTVSHSALPASPSATRPHVYKLLFADSHLDVEALIPALTAETLAPYVIAAQPNYLVQAETPAEGPPARESMSAPAAAEVLSAREPASAPPTEPLASLLESSHPLVASEPTQAVSSTTQRLTRAASLAAPLAPVLPHASVPQPQTTAANFSSPVIVLAPNAPASGTPAPGPETLPTPSTDAPGLPAASTSSTAPQIAGSGHPPSGPSPAAPAPPPPPATTSPLDITTRSLPDGTLGTPYLGSLTATGGVPPYYWSLAYGSLPPGLYLDGTSGTISGTPTSSGTNVLRFEVTDSASPPASALTPALFFIEIREGSDSIGLSLTSTVGQPITSIGRGGTYLAIFSGPNVTDQMCFDVRVRRRDFSVIEQADWQCGLRGEHVVSTTEMLGDWTLIDVRAHLGRQNPTNPTGEFAPIGVTLTIRPQPGNRAPIITPPRPLTISEGATVIDDISASDPDGDLLTYKTSELPPWVSLTRDPAASPGLVLRFNWTPVRDLVGRHDISLTVSDGDLEARETITVTVSPLTPLPAPSLASINPSQFVSGSSNVVFVLSGANFQYGAKLRLFHPPGILFLETDPATEPRVRRGSSTQLAWGPFQRPIQNEPGDYDFQVQHPDGQRSGTVRVTVTSVVTPYTLTVPRALVGSGEPMTVYWRAPVERSPLDRIGLYEVGASERSYPLESQILPGTSSQFGGTMTFADGYRLGPGQYEMRYLRDRAAQGFGVVAKSNVVTVGMTPTVQRPKVQVFLLEDVTTCIVADECSSEQCIPIRQIGTGQTVRSFNQAGFLTRTRATLGSPNSGLTRQQIDSAYCLTMRLDQQQIDAIKREIDTFKHTVFEYSQHRIDPEIQVIESRNQGITLSPGAPALWVGPGDVELAISNYYQRETDFMVVVSPISDQAQRVYFQPGGCDGSYAGAGNHGVGFSWIPAGLQNTGCANHLTMLHAFLHQLGDITNRIAPPQDPGFLPYGQDNYDYAGERLSCSTTRFRSPYAYFPDADVAPLDPDFDSCAGRYGDNWNTYCHAVNQGVDGEECNRRWDRHVLGVHFPPNYQIIGNSCRNGRQDVGETAVDRGGPCAVYTRPEIRTVIIRPESMTAGQPLDVILTGVDFGNNTFGGGRLDILEGGSDRVLVSFTSSVWPQWGLLWFDQRIELVLYPAFTQTYQSGIYTYRFRLTRSDGRQSDPSEPQTLAIKELPVVQRLLISPDPIVLGQPIAVELYGVGFGSQSGRLDLLGSTDQLLGSFSGSVQDKWAWMWRTDYVRLGEDYVWLGLLPAVTLGLQPGTHTLKVRLTRADGRSDVVEQLVTVTAPTRPAPTLFPLAPTLTLTAGREQTLTFSGANFQPGAGLVYRPRAGGEPTVIQEGIQVAATGTSLTFTWTPPLAAVGTYDVAVRNPDGQVSPPPYAQVTVEAAPVSPPDLAVTAVAFSPPSPTVGQPLTLQGIIRNVGQASAPRSQASYELRFFRPGEPGGRVVHSNTTAAVEPLEAQREQTVRWEGVPVAEAGEYTVRLCTSGRQHVPDDATAENNCATQTLQVQPAPPPTITRFVAEPAQINMGQQSTSTLRWESRDARTCEASGYWSGMKDPSGTEVVRPMSPGAFTYTLVCYGARVSSDSMSPPLAVTVTVRAPNRAPVISRQSPEAFTITEGEPFFVGVFASDPDGDPVTFAATLPLPAGARFDAAGHIFRWTPAQGQARPEPYGVTFIVSDGQLEARQTISITVVTVSAPPPPPPQPTCSLTFNGVTQAHGPAGTPVTVTIQWETQYASAYAGRPPIEYACVGGFRGSGPVEQPRGELILTLSQDTYCWITPRNASGQTSCSASFTVAAPPPPPPRPSDPWYPDPPWDGGGGGEGEGAGGDGGG